MKFWPTAPTLTEQQQLAWIEHEEYRFNCIIGLVALAIASEVVKALFGPRPTKAPRKR